MILFDLDGTLCDTTAVDIEVFLATAEEALGCPPCPPGGWESCSHVTDPGVLEWLWLQQHGRRPTRAEVEAFIGSFVSRLRQVQAQDPHRFQPIPGALALLHTLGTCGWQMGIATGGWGASARLKLGAARIPEDLLLASADDSPNRVEIFRLGHQRMSPGSPFSDGQAVLVGDGVWDGRVARELGWRFIGVASDERATRLREVGASAVFPDLRDVPAFISAVQSCSVAPILNPST